MGKGGGRDRLKFAQVRLRIGQATCGLARVRICLCSEGRSGTPRPAFPSWGAAGGPGGHGDFSSAGEEPLQGAAIARELRWATRRTVPSTQQFQRRGGSGGRSPACRPQPARSSTPEVTGRESVGRRTSRIGRTMLSHVEAQVGGVELHRLRDAEASACARRSRIRTLLLMGPPFFFCFFWSLPPPRYPCHSHFFFFKFFFEWLFVSTCHYVPSIAHLRVSIYHLALVSSSWYSSFCHLPLSFFVRLWPCRMVRVGVPSALEVVSWGTPTN